MNPSSLLHYLAHIVSVILFPGIMPTLSVFIALHYGKSSAGLGFEPMAIILGLVFMLTFIFPAISVISLRFTGVIKTLRMENRKERPIPFVITSIYFTFTSYLFGDKFPMMEEAWLCIAAIAATTCICTLITFKFKISVHTIGLSGCAGTASGLLFHSQDDNLFLLCLTLFFCTGLVMSARLKLNAHTLPEVMAGAFAGFIGCFAVQIF